MSALAYPNNADNISHTQAVEILNKVQLGHLAEQLEKNKTGRVFFLLANNSVWRLHD